MEVRMVPEVERWLAGIRDRDPAVAEGIDEAVAALRAGGTSAGPPLVVPVERPSSVTGAGSVPAGAGSVPAGRPRSRRGRPGRPAVGVTRWLLARTALPGLDAAYERQRDMLTPVRRTVADVATSRKRLELQIAQLERQVAGPGEPEGTATGSVAERLAALRRQYAALQAEEERITVASQRLQASLDEFQTRKEAAKAAYLAAQEEAEATWAEVTGNGGAGSGTGPVDDDPGGAVQGPFWLKELRPSAPESAGIRILFTVEPSGTALLLAAGTESDRLHAWYAEAIARSGLRYRRKQRRATVS
jgi:hypothetical protein